MRLRKDSHFCKLCRTLITGKDKRFCNEHCQQEWETLQEDQIKNLQEWPMAMSVIKPFAQHDRDPGDRYGTFPMPDPERFGQSGTGSSAAYAESKGSLKPY